MIRPLAQRATALATSVLGREFALGAVGTLSVRLTFVALEFTAGLALARFLGAAGYGVYAVVMSTVALLAIPGAAGFDRLLIREVAALRTLGNWELLRGVLRRSTQVVLCCSVVVAIAGYLAFESLVPGDAATALLLGMALVPLLALARIRQSALQGFGRVVFGQLPEMVVQPALMLSLVGAAFTCGVTRSGTVAVLLQVIAAAVACLIGVVFLRRSLPVEVRDARPEFRTRYWMSNGIPLVAMMALNVVLTNADTVMLGILAETELAGIYRISSQMASLVAFPLTAVNMAIAPRIASLHATSSLEELRAQAVSVANASLAAALPIALALVMFGKPLLGFFGSDFVAGYPAIVILSVGYVFNSAAGCAGYLLIMTGHEKSAAVAFAGAALVNVSGNLLLIPTFGLMGAAIATALSVLIVSTAFAWLSHRLLGVRAIPALSR